MSRRVLHVVTGFEAAGAERSLARVVGALPPDRWTHLVVGLGPAGPVTDDLRSRGIEAMAAGARSVLSLPRVAATVARAARRFRPDLVHGWMYHGNLAALWASAVTRPRPPLLWGIRQGLYDFDDSPRATRAAILLGARLSSAPRRILYNSRAAARQHEAAGYAAGGTRIVPNGLDVDAFARGAGSRERVRSSLGLGEADPVIVLPARWHPVKDHRGFARAARRLVERRAGVRFVLCGRGIDAGNRALAGILGEEGVGGHCLLLGERHDMAEILSCADLATLSSMGESFPNALAEAMACGIPCVGTDVGDVRDLIGDTGIVVPPSDPDALSAAWDELLARDPSHRARMGQSARERIRRRFGLDRAVEALQGVYAETLDG